MRNHIFKAKTKSHKKLLDGSRPWVVGYFATESNHACLGIENVITGFILQDVFMDWGLGGLESTAVEMETVCEGTGFRCKGREGEDEEIFECDILKWWEENILETEMEREGVVYWDADEGKWMIEIREVEGKKSISKGALATILRRGEEGLLTELRVVGNVWDEKY